MLQIKIANRLVSFAVAKLTDGSNSVTMLPLHVKMSVVIMMGITN